MADNQPHAPAAMASELRAVIGRLSRRLREQADSHSLSLSQAVVLSLLEREGASTVTSLARAEAMRPQSMGATIAILETAGLVEGASDPSDGRQTLWSLTDGGHQWIRSQRAVRDDWLAQMIQTRLDVAELRSLAKAIPLLERLVET